MNEPLTVNSIHELEREIVSILINSDLYLDMDLAERYRLIHFIQASYFASSVADSRFSPL